MTQKEILIVGAGPSGLSMAIFLHELGFQPTIIDKKTAISKYSKALGVNPRTLEIFEPYGITDNFLANGRKMTAINLWKGDRFIYKNDLSKVNHRFPFMLIQAQKESEEILLEEVQKRNIKIAYGTEFLSYQKVNTQYLVSLKGQSNFNTTFDYIIGADGGRSSIRTQSGIPFKGYSYEEEWELYDIALTTNLSVDEGHIRLFPEGGMIMIRLKKDIWRVAGNIKSLLNYLSKNTQTGTIHWASTFHIHHKVAQNLTKDNIAIIGDAAHLHSPVGARGMNLGIEDAYMASQLIKANNLKAFSKMRRPYLSKTVNRINNMTMGLAGDARIPKLIRTNIQLLRPFFPMIIPNVRAFIMGWQ